MISSAENRKKRLRCVWVFPLIDQMIMFTHIERVSRRKRIKEDKNLGAKKKGMYNVSNKYDVKNDDNKRKKDFSSFSI